jgi:hypothetical protein
MRQRNSNLIRLGGPKRLLEQRWQDLEIAVRDRVCSALKQLRHQLHEIGLEFCDVLLHHSLPHASELKRQQKIHKEDGLRAATGGKVAVRSP